MANFQKVQNLSGGILYAALFFCRLVAGFSRFAKINLEGTRNTYYLSYMKQANKHPRKTRTYKVTDLVYKKARRRASKEKVKLSTMIEMWVKSYSNDSAILES